MIGTENIDASPYSRKIQIEVGNIRYDAEKAALGASNRPEWEDFLNTVEIFPIYIGAKTFRDPINPTTDKEQSIIWDLAGRRKAEYYTRIWRDPLHSLFKVIADFYEDRLKLGKADDPMAQSAERVLILRGVRNYQTHLRDRLDYALVEKILAGEAIDEYATALALPPSEPAFTNRPANVEGRPYLLYPAFDQSGMGKVLKALEVDEDVLSKVREIDLTSATQTSFYSGLSMIPPGKIPEVNLYVMLGKLGEMPKLELGIMLSGEGRARAAMAPIITRNFR